MKSQKSKLIIGFLVGLFVLSSGMILVNVNQMGKVTAAAESSFQDSSGPPVPPGITNPVIAYTPPAVVSSFTWSGGAFPTSNGKVMYPPLAQYVTNSPLKEDHYYAGGTFTGSSANATWLFSEITVPKTEPNPKEFYYVLASLWDHNGSYDQIDFAADYGTWGLTYSWTSGLNPISCEGSLKYHYNPDAMNLTLGTTYKFYIATNSSGLWFESFVGSKMVWYLHANKSNTELAIEQYFCGYYDYTNYEEVWYILNGAPSFNFFFALNQYQTSSGWTKASWGTFYVDSPPKVHVTIKGQSVTIHN